MKRKITAFILGGVLLLTTFSIAVGTDDPLITESYLRNVFLGEVKGYINSSSVFSVVTVKQGQKFRGDSGCEFILRQGKASVDGASLGGLSDVTDGYDLASGIDVPPNHHLIVPRNDGRGFTALTDVVIMVKGAYTISY